MRETKRVNAAMRILHETYPCKSFELLGTGYESIAFTDGQLVFKVVDKIDINWDLLLGQLVGRFKGCRRIFDIIDHKKVDSVHIFMYQYEPSEPYCGGRKDEIIEFLIECWQHGIVHWDVKPLNFRIFTGGLKLIDYGRDIKPFNYKDFVFMVQRAYLMLDQGNHRDFKALASRALVDWDIDELKGFTVFFNEVYSQILKRVRDLDSVQPISMFSRNQLMERINEFATELCPDGNVITIKPYARAKEHRHTGLSQELFRFENLDTKRLKSYDLVIIDLLDSVNPLDSMKEMVCKVRKKLRIGVRILFVLKNPYFYNPDIHNPIDKIKRQLYRNGITVDNIIFSDYQYCLNGDSESDYLFITSSVNEDAGIDVSLVIKACYQDGHVLEHLIRHIVHQLEGPDSFVERIVVLDPKQGEFLRQYHDADKEQTYKALDILLSEGIIDKYLCAPTEREQIADINERWFGLRTSETHCISNVPVTPQLYAFESVNSDYILQVDSDAIIVRRDWAHSYLRDMKEALIKNKKALSMSFNIAHSMDSGKKEYTSPGNGSFVPEVRFCLIDRKRFLSNRPYPNSLIDGKLGLTWYRSVEKAQLERGLVSLRGGDSRSFYIHPPNDVKRDVT